MNAGLERGGYNEGNGLPMRVIFDDSIFEMIPLQRLHRHLRCRVGLVASLAYGATHSLTALDRFLLLLYEAWQKRTNRYGLISCVARNPGP